MNKPNTVTDWERASEIREKIIAEAFIKNPDTGNNYLDLTKTREIIVEAFKQVRLEAENKWKFECITRVEVIDHTRSFENGGGRVYTHWDKNTRATIDLQDDGKTLKVFINKLKA